MPILTVTAKGQVTFRKDILAHLGVAAGDQIEVDLLPDGGIAVHASRPTGHVSDVFGMLSDESGPRLTIDDINAVIADGWAGKR